MGRQAFYSFVTLAALAAAPAVAADLPDPADPSVAAVLTSPSRFFARVGAAHLMLSEDATLRAAGTLVPGATINIEDHTTALIELGYRFNPNLSLAFTGGFPPDIEILGAGTAEPFGPIGGLLYGPTALTLQYQARDWGWFQPYVGVGPMMMFVFENDDGAMQDLKVDPAVGIVAQVGADLMVNDNFGVFVDAKKAYLRTEASGTLGGAPVEADVRLDPFVLSGGVTFRF